MRLDTKALPPTLLGMKLPALRPARRRGQILPILAVGLFALAMFATILIDASMMLQARRDIEVIAQHAAEAGAQQFDYAAYRSTCPSGTTAANCAARIQLESTARSVAENTATQWIAENERSNALALIGRAPSASDGVSSAWINSPLARSGVSVTITRCYNPFFINIFTGNQGQGCVDSTPITVTATSRPIGGY